MKFRTVHSNYNVYNLEKSLDFYDKALNLKEVRRSLAKDGSFILVYLENKESTHQIELTWLRDKKEPYNLGDNEIHLAFVTNDYDGALKHHKEMNVVCFENNEMGIYFISDPDGYWLEIVPEK